MLKRSGTNMFGTEIARSGKRMDALEDAGNDAVEDDVYGPPEEVSFQNDSAAQGMLMRMILLHRMRMLGG